MKRESPTQKSFYFRQHAGGIKVVLFDKRWRQVRPIFNSYIAKWSYVKPAKERLH